MTLQPAPSVHQAAVRRCRCGAPVVDWDKHARWHQGVICDCGCTIEVHPINWKDWAKHRVPDACLHCDTCLEYKPRLAS